MKNKKKNNVSFISHFFLPFPSSPWSFVSLVDRSRSGSRLRLAGFLLLHYMEASDRSSQVNIMSMWDKTKSVSIRCATEVSGSDIGSGTWKILEFGDYNACKKKKKVQNSGTEQRKRPVNSFVLPKQVI